MEVLVKNIRKIKKVFKGRPTLEGAGVRLKRVFGNSHVPQLDPFLLLDDFHSDEPGDYIRGFPWHPHRGIETITYILDGTVEHGDSMKNSGIIFPGDVQWMTAGSGIIHQEMPKGNKHGMLWGFQLWANLPASHKMMDPRYRGISKEDIPETVLRSGAKVKIISGMVNGVRGPVRDIITNPEYLDVTLPVHSEFSREIKRGYTAFAYVVHGEGYFDECQNPFEHDVEGLNYFDIRRECALKPESLALYGDGDGVRVSTRGLPVRFLLISGKPIGEPVAWYGPIVMNTNEELRTAFEEYEKGTFVKQPQFAA
jgi:redox-sensitive bicupin YhaK (pirin superfamily)